MNCRICKKKLIVPSWKTCQTCDPQYISRHQHDGRIFKKDLKTKDKTIDAIDIATGKEKTYAVSERLHCKNLQYKRIILIDEDDIVIGFQNGVYR